MDKTDSVERRLVEQFLDALRGLPGVKADLDIRKLADKWRSFGFGARVNLHVAGKSFSLLIGVKETAVFPRDAERVIRWSREVCRLLPTVRGKEALPVVVATSISPGAKELLERERIGYCDSGGSLFLHASGMHLHIDKPLPKAFTKSMRGMFSGRRAQVLHALLVQHRDWFGVTALAGRAMVSLATASQTLTEIERFGWLISRGQGPNKERRLNEPGALLNAWGKQLASSPPALFRRYYVPELKTDGLLDKLAKVFDVYEVQYEVSYEAAAQRLAPFLSNISQVRARVLADPKADAAIVDLGGRTVDSGANLEIIDTQSRGELLFRSRTNDLWLASPIRIYLDLVRGEGRSKEMAEFFRKERIGF